MKTLSLLAILVTLLILAFKQPGKSFQDAAVDAGAKALDVISSTATVNEAALKEKAKTLAFDEKFRALRERVEGDQNPNNVQEGDASKVWVMPSSTLDPGPAPNAMPVDDVNTAEIPSLPMNPVYDVASGEVATVISEETEIAEVDYNELSRLYEESARLLMGIK